MGRKLDDFQAEVHLDGWFFREDSKGHHMRAGQRFKGSAITKRMIQAIEEEDTFRDKTTGEEKPVMTLVGGSVEDLKALIASGLDEEPDAPVKKKDASPPKEKEKKSATPAKKEAAKPSSGEEEKPKKKVTKRHPRSK